MLLPRPPVSVPVCVPRPAGRSTPEHRPSPGPLQPGQGRCFLGESRVWIRLLSKLRLCPRFGCPAYLCLSLCVCHAGQGLGLSARPRAPLPAEERVGLTPVLASGSPRGVTGAASRSGRPGLFCTRSSHIAGPLAGTQPSGTLPPGGPGKIPGLGLRAPGPGGTSSYMAPQGGLLPAGARRWASKTVTVRVLACGRAGLRHRAPRHRAPRHRGLNGKETASSPEGNLSLCGARGSGHQSEDLSLVPSHHTPTH